jgi:hypothetical protein
MQDLLSITRLIDCFDSPRPDTRWSSAVWLALGVLLVLAVLLVLRLSGLAGLT